MSPSTKAEIDNVCVALFRKLTALDERQDGAAMSDVQVLVAPLDSFELDSLSTMEFIMAVEDQFNVALDEDAVNNCASLEQLSGLVAKQLNV